MSRLFASSPAANPSLFSFRDGSTLYASSAQWLITIPVWEANRVMDLAHIDALEAAISDPTHIQGPFTIIRYNDEETERPQWRILDGQHRQELIRRYFARNPDAADFSVLTRHYKTLDHDSAVTLFTQINTAKPMVYRDSPEEHLNAIVAELRRRFTHDGRSGRLVALIRPGANRPALNTEHLLTALRSYGLHERDPVDVIAHAVKMNGLWKQNPALCPAKFTQTIHERAVEYDFFLGLDPRCSWLQGLL